MAVLGVLCGLGNDENTIATEVRATAPLHEVGNTWKKCQLQEGSMASWELKLDPDIVETTLIW